jgi:putative CocE/NonD family hydrolase
VLRILDGADGTTCGTSAETREICADDGLTGATPEPVGGPRGAALLRAARAQHNGNVNLINFAPAGVFRDYSSGQQSWAVTSVGAHRAAIQAGGVPILTFTGWLDAGTANGLLSQFTSLSNTQEDWIGPWSHGENYFADPFRPSRPLASAEHQQLDEALYAFFDRYVKNPGRPGGTRVLHYYTLNQGTWRTTTTWPPPGTLMRPLYLAAGHMPALTDRGPLDFWRRGAVPVSATSASRAWRLSHRCPHAAVAVSLTGSRTVRSPKSATRSSRPPRAST